MGFVARTEEETIRWGEKEKGLDPYETSRGGIKEGQEVLNHYCDIDLPVKERREVSHVSKFTHAKPTSGPQIMAIY